MVSGSAAQLTAMKSRVTRPDWSVEEAGHAFLAGAGIALDQHGGIAAGDPPGQRHEAGAAGVAHGGNGGGPRQLRDQGEGEAHVLQAEGDTRGQAVCGRHQRRRTVDQIDQYVAMGRMADFRRQQHAPVFPLARALRIHDPYGKERILQPVLQARNERADSSAHVQ